MAGGMRCAWHFSAKGQLSGSHCQKRGEEGEITAAGAHSSLSLLCLYHFHLSKTLLPVSRCPYLPLDLSLVVNSVSFLSVVSIRLFASLSFSPTLNSVLYKPSASADPAVVQIKWPFGDGMHRIWLSDDKS